MSVRLLGTDNKSTTSLDSPSMGNSFGFKLDETEFSEHPIKQTTKKVTLTER